MNMAQNSKIEWTDHTANLWWGCTKVNIACNNCYADEFSTVQLKENLWGSNAPRKVIKRVFLDLAKWQRNAQKSDKIERVFVGSMMDIFEKSMPLVDHKGNSIFGTKTGDLRDILFQKITDGEYPNLMFLLLTKRPSNINKYIPESWKSNPPKNVMFGTSVADQKTANNAIPHLCKVNGKRFLSCEPLLDSLDLNNFFYKTDETGIGIAKQIHWVIVGGESGSNKRPFNPDWARSIKRQCKVTETPFFMKQWDKIKPIPKDLMVREFPKLHKLKPELF